MLPQFNLKTSLATIVATILLALNAGLIYPQTLEVVDFRPDQNTVVLSTSTGILYEYPDEYPADDADFHIGELYSCIMCNEYLTQVITDDYILWLHGTGFVAENFVKPQF